MSKAITENPYESLGNAIIFQAVKDYRSALRKIKHNPKNRMAIDEAVLIEKFFRGQLYGTITNVDGEFLIEKLRKEVAQSSESIRVNPRKDIFSEVDYE